MAERLPIIVRANQIAASGHCRTLTEVKYALKREGYERLDAEFNGGWLRKQLRDRMQAAAAGRRLS